LPAIPRTSSSTDARATARQQSLSLACRCAQVAEELRGKDTTVLDLTAVTPIADFFVITTGTSGRQMRAVAEEVNRILREHGSRRLGIEGKQDSQWILYDFGDIVLHVFSPEARKLYDLEHLWADAPRVDWKGVNSPA
jgi:ribosome-associated protein